MDIVFDDDHARVPRSVHDKLVSAVEDDVVAVACIERHQGVTTAECARPPGEVISKLKHRVVGDGIEVMVAIDEAGLRVMSSLTQIFATSVGCRN
jgi:hypothetical protein